MESSRLDYLVLTATAFEQTTIVEAMGGIEPTVLAHRRTVFGQIVAPRVAVIEAGIGLTNTAQALTAVLQSHKVGLVIQVGIGGAYPSSGLGVGDLAIATEEILGEFGVVDDSGWSDGQTIGIPLLDSDPPIHNHIDLDEQATQQSQAAAQTVASTSGAQCKSGSFLTVQNVTGTDKQAALLDNRFSALCENMEGAAAAQVCRLYDVPFTEIRGISNIVESRDLSKWDITTAASRAQSAALELIRSSA